MPDLEILLNNGMMWFDPRRDRPNSIAPGEKPLANMSPVIAVRGKKPEIALGAAGGRKIVPAVAQILSYLVDLNYITDTSSAISATTPMSWVIRSTDKPSSDDNSDNSCNI